LGLNKPFFFRASIVVKNGKGQGGKNHGGENLEIKNCSLSLPSFYWNSPYTGKNLKKILGIFCIFPKSFPFFLSKWANNSPILREKNIIFWEKYKKNWEKYKKILTISPSA